MDSAITAAPIVILAARFTRSFLKIEARLDVCADIGKRVAYFPPHSGAE